MCGRFRFSRKKQLVEEYFDCGSDEPDWNHRYNIEPTQPVAVIRQNPTEPVRELSLVRWGLIPSWAKDSSAAAQMINARSETAGTKPAFRDALKFRRCLIPADGFYEWMRTGCALKAHGVQFPEMETAAKPSSQPRTESCVMSGNGHCEAETGRMQAGTSVNGKIAPKSIVVEVADPIR